MRGLDLLVSTFKEPFSSQLDLSRHLPGRQRSLKHLQNNTYDTFYPIYIIYPIAATSVKEKIEKPWNNG